MERILIELGGSEVYFLISFRLDRLDEVEVMEPGDMGELETS